MHVLRGINDVRGEEMPDRYLGMCYACIFDGLPVQELRIYERFIEAHEQHDPPIETLGDFVEHYNDVTEMFQDNDFAREYARLSRNNAERYPAAQARLSTDGLTRALAAMCETIDFLGEETVQQTIDAMVRDFLPTSEHPDRDPHALNTHIRAFLCHAHYVTPRAPVYGGAELTIGHLLSRLQNVYA